MYFSCLEHLEDLGSANDNIMHVQNHDREDGIDYSLCRMLKKKMTKL